MYWPETTSEQRTIGQFTITLLEEHVFAEYVVRKLKYVHNKVSTIFIILSLMQNYGESLSNNQMDTGLSRWCHEAECEDPETRNEV